MMGPALLWDESASVCASSPQHHMHVRTPDHKVGLSAHRLNGPMSLEGKVS